MDPNIDALLWNGRSRDSHGTEKIYGVVPAIVVKINDDKEKRHQMGAVQVRFPYLLDEGASQDLLPWARCTSFATGNNGDDAPCGWVSTPQINDEVLVGFEHGDPQRPYVLGQLWNPKSADAAQAGQGGAAGGGGGGGGGAGQDGGGGNWQGQQGGGADAAQAGQQQQAGQQPGQQGAAPAEEAAAEEEAAGQNQPTQVGGGGQQPQQQGGPPPDPDEAPPAPPPADQPGAAGGAAQDAGQAPPAPPEPAPIQDPGPVPADPMLKRVREKFPQGYTMVMYAKYTTQNGNNREIESQAKKIAADHEAVSVVNGRIEMGKPIPIEHVDKAIEAVATCGRVLKEKLQAEGGGDQPFIKVKNLAICVHGMPYGVSLNKTGSYGAAGLNHGIRGGASNIPKFVDGIRAFIKDDIGVQLFACNTARDIPRLRECWQAAGTSGMAESDAGYKRSTYQEWIEHDENRPQARESFAANLQAALGPGSTVYGHGTAGHLHRNFAAKAVGAKAGGGGLHMFCLIFPTDFVDAEANKLFAAEQGENKVALRFELREVMWSHYTKAFGDSYRGLSEQLGRLSFFDLDKAKQEMQADWPNFFARESSEAKVRKLTKWKKLSRAQREALIAGPGAGG